MDTSDKVFIGADFPSELKGSSDTKRLFGANAKAKANATQGIPVLLQCAVNIVGRKMLKNNIIKMQSLGGIGLQQDLRYRYIIMIQRKWKDLMYIE